MDVVKLPVCVQTCCILYHFGVLVYTVMGDQRKPWKFFITVDWEEDDFWNCLFAKLQRDEWNVEETENYSISMVKKHLRSIAVG